MVAKYRLKLFTIELVKAVHYATGIVPQAGLFVCLSDIFQSNFALFNKIVFKSEYIDKWKTKHAQIKCKVMYIVPFTLWYEIFVVLHISLIRNNQILRSDFRLETADKQTMIYDVLLPS